MVMNNTMSDVSINYDNSNKSFVLSFLDVETTGLSAACNDRICEIAVLRRRENGRMTNWQSLINPQRPISLEAKRVNNISNEMVKDAPTFDKVADKVLEMVKDAIIVCHNVPFDLSFLSSFIRISMLIGSYYSYSRLNSFLTCPYQFKLKYIDGIDTKQSIEAYMGSNVHYTLEYLYNQLIENKPCPTLKDLLIYYKQPLRSPFYQRQQITISFCPVQLLSGC